MKLSAQFLLLPFVGAIAIGCESASSPTSSTTPEQVNPGTPKKTTTTKVGRGNTKVIARAQETGPAYKPGIPKARPDL